MYLTVVSPRIGVLYAGDPHDPLTWSGIPNGLIHSLEELGLDVCGINVDAGRPISLAVSLIVGGVKVASIARAGLNPTPRELRRVGSMSPTVAAMMSMVARRRLAGSGPLDGLIQIGTGYSIASRVPIVTFEDMTVLQAHKAGFAWRAMSARAVGARMARQRDAYLRARACCVTTHWAAESIISDYGIPAEKVRVVGIGRNFDPGETPLPHDWSRPRFLFIGREWERKNGPRVLAAFARLRADVPDARLDVVGGHPPLDAEGGVVGHGVLRLDDDADRKRLADLFTNATCFVMPSLHEPSAQAYVEASAWGIPSIVTSNGGSAELVRDGAITVDPLDDQGLLEAMSALCDPATAARLGGIAQRHSSLFTSRAMAGRLLRALDLPSIPAKGLPAFL
jgi:hypothetical protein